MKVDINNESHHVLLIQYENGEPFHMTTEVYVEDAPLGPYWECCGWVLFTDKDSGNFKAYERGSGRCGEFSIYFIDPSNMSVWTNGKRTISCNAEIIPMPLEWEGSANPLETAEIAEDCSYCRKCGAYSEELCSEHLYYDGGGSIRWKGNHRYYEA